MIKRTIKSLKIIKNYLSHILTRRDILFYVGGYPDIPNVGDVALFNSYQKFFPNHKIIHFVGGKLELFLYGVFCREHKAILAGGTLINHMCLREAEDSIKVLNNFSVFGTGVAQGSYWNGRKGYENQIGRWKILLDQCDFVGVRGPLSEKELIDNNIKAQMFGDPVITLSKDTKKPFSKGRKRIGLNIGRSLGNVQGGEENLAKIFKNLAIKLKSEGFEIHWFVVCPEDLEITEELAKYSKTEEHIYRIYNSYEEYYECCENIDFFVGTKLHAVCLAMCTYIPSIMIEYRPKCRDFMASIHQEKWSLPAEFCSLDQIYSVLEEIETNYEQEVEQLYNEIQSQKKSQLNVINHYLGNI